MICNIHTPKVAFACAFFITLFTFLAAFVPQWHVIYPGVKSMGLRKECMNDVCNDIDFNTSPCQKASDWQNRFRTSDAFLWIGVVVCIFLVVASIVKMACFNDADHKKVSLVMILLLIISSGFFVISAAIYGSTTDSKWLRCNETLCDFWTRIFPGTVCYYGVSMGLLVAAILLLIVCIPLVITTMCEFAVAHQRKILVATLILVTIAGCFAIAADATSQWTTALYPLQSLGAMQTCSGTACKPNEYKDTSYMGCTRSGTDIKNRFGVVVAFMIMSAIIMGVMMVYFFITVTGCIHLPEHPFFRFIVFAICTVACAFAVISVAVYGDTVNNFLTCGKQTYCELMARRGDTCTYGVSIALAFLAFLCWAIMLPVLLLDICGCCNHLGADEPSKNEPTNEGAAPAPAAHKEPAPAPAATA